MNINCRSVRGIIYVSMDGGKSFRSTGVRKVSSDDYNAIKEMARSCDTLDQLLYLIRYGMSAETTTTLARAVKDYLAMEEMPANRRKYTERFYNFLIKENIRVTLGEVDLSIRGNRKFKAERTGKLYQAYHRHLVENYDLNRYSTVYKHFVDFGSFRKYMRKNFEVRMVSYYNHIPYLEEFPTRITLEAADAIRMQPLDHDWSKTNKQAWLIGQLILATSLRIGAIRGLRDYNLIREGDDHFIKTLTNKSPVPVKAYLPPYLAELYQAECRKNRGHFLSTHYRRKKNTFRKVMSRGMKRIYAELPIMHEHGVDFYQDAWGERHHQRKTNIELVSPHVLRRAVITQMRMYADRMHVCHLAGHDPRYDTNDKHYFTLDVERYTEDIAGAAKRIYREARERIYGDLKVVKKDSA